MPSSFFFITPWKMLWKLDIAAVVKVISLGLGVICRVANEIIVEGKQTLTRKKISFFYSLRFSFHSHYFLFFLRAIFLLYHPYIVEYPPFVHSCIIITSRLNLILEWRAEKWRITGFGVQQTYQSAGLKHPPRWLPHFNRGEPLARRIRCNKRPARQRGLQDDLGGTVGSTVGGSFGGMKSGRLHPSLARIFPSLLRNIHLFHTLSLSLSLLLPSTLPSATLSFPFCVHLIILLPLPPSLSLFLSLPHPLSILHSCAHCRRISVWSGRAEVSSS